ncbi:hypothetical protein JBL43_20050 [Aureibaculum sp. A20]|uniref:DUF3592 domain-containing protein n=1 Tax=Aureibaculum flavum TaxID=2795986 RepID=A0ABS0WX31_9FLAO|nr:hypothetical protein [Aureibaculum flavum]MBJ2176552.1 hypothetical protein [Aureibaculum flavum]
MIFYVSIIEAILASAFLFYFLRFYRFKYKSLKTTGIIKELTYSKPFRRASTELVFGEGKDVLVKCSFLLNDSIYNCISKHKEIKYPDSKKYKVGNSINVFALKSNPSINTSIGHKSRFQAVIALLIVLLFWSILVVFIIVKNYS